MIELPPSKLKPKLKYTMPEKEVVEAYKNGRGSKSEKVEEEKGAYDFPPDMYLTSKLVLSEKNIEAAEEYLKKAEHFHHLWQPNDEVSYIRKAILIHNDAKEKRRQ